MSEESEFEFQARVIARGLEQWIPLADKIPPTDKRWDRKLSVPVIVLLPGHGEIKECQLVLRDCELDDYPIDKGDWLVNGRAWKWNTVTHWRAPQMQYSAPLEGATDDRIIEEMHDLKPCPFCGTDDELVIEEDERKLSWRVYCDTCGLHTDDYPTREHAVSAWNTRPIEDNLITRIAELESEQRWIPITERMPEPMVPVLIIEIELGIMVAHRLVGTFKGWTTNGDGGIICEATHWMPLPDGPKVTK